MGSVNQKLATQSVAKTFFQYFIPTLLGMMLMSVNVVVDGIFVGNGVGSVALASVNIAVPVFSVIISLALLVGMGGGTLYSIAMGENNDDRARKIFTLSMALITVITVVVSVISYINLEALALFFGANQETLPYVLDYMRILFLSSLILSLEAVLSIFVRNDGDPQLAMMGLVVSAILNIGLNYWMIFILELEVKGAALATVIATAFGLLIYTFHFLKKGSNLKLVKMDWNWRSIKSISTIGFPSFLSEAGMGIFVVGYNIAMEYHVGTDGLSAFSVINYLHVFMFLAFIGIASTIQPMISYYYGAKQAESIKKTVKIAETTGISLGLLFLAIGYFGATQLVAIFGIESESIVDLATTGLKLFFLGYLFMGINFIYMTYYQSIGNIKPSIGITLFRGVILLILMLLILPFMLGTAGIWLALPAAEALVAVFLLIFARKHVMEKTFLWHQVQD
ncbi:MATE family efflux transporter [Virgibacillus alimentarius]|uniref:Multidrug export protein MepA n=1 Tax=Virgibacillus alimentarius TaxID=698769 RepID=A0ABS4SC98_9BACI|nr:MATE family efflux transporter [Virgibacillus alimentarius]MBP2259121.1 putative MATE family efflux protein [Virgibacillus alimentarius]